MTSARGQASAEYAGLLALAALLGASVALVAGPPLARVVRDALIAASFSPARQSTPLVASAADIADVQAGLLASGESLTPEATLAALAARNGETRAEQIAGALLLETARATAPWLGRTRTYRPWTDADESPFETSDSPLADQDVETPTGPPVVTWITVGAQSRALADLLAHHTSARKVGLDLVSMVPAAAIGRLAVAGGVRLAAKDALERVPRAVGAGSATGDAITLIGIGEHRSGVPPGMRAGDIEIAWPVHRRFSRDGRDEAAAGERAVPADYAHLVILRPTAEGLQVVAEGGP